MSKIFDRFEKLVFNTVGRIHGEVDEFLKPILATWVSADGLASYSGVVLFSNPTHKETLDQIEYAEIDPYFEYLAPAFTGLKLRVESSKNEIVNISGIDYYVTQVNQLSDGNTLKAYIQLVTSEYGPTSV